MESIWARLASDGFDPNPAPAFLGALGRLVPGVWRPTPRADAGTPAAVAGPQFATMMPWVLLWLLHSVRPHPTRRLQQARLTWRTRRTSPIIRKPRPWARERPRSPDQSELALFWAGSTLLFWIRIASQVSAVRHLSLVANVATTGDDVVERTLDGVLGSRTQRWQPDIESLAGTGRFR